MESLHLMSTFRTLEDSVEINIFFFQNYADNSNNNDLKQNSFLLWRKLYIKHWEKKFKTSKFGANNFCIVKSREVPSLKKMTTFCAKILWYWYKTGHNFISTCYIWEWTYLDWIKYSLRQLFSPYKEIQF